MNNKDEIKILIKDVSKTMFKNYIKSLYQYTL